jgi:hypothetical protein
MPGPHKAKMEVGPPFPEGAAVTVVYGAQVVVTGPRTLTKWVVVLPAMYPV